MISKPKFKICKRLGSGVYDKCQTTKFSVSDTKTTNKKRKSVSEYGAQLIEKQKIRFTYGITEKQLSNYVKKVSSLKGTQISDKFYEELESRLDNVVYRMGLSSTRRAARQMVSHGHLVVNGKKVTIPSFKIKIGDIVEIREGSKSKKIFSDLSLKLKEYTMPLWLSFDVNKMTGKVLSLPKNSETFFDFNSVLEFYSR